MKILFVCTGNTCRSPLAEAIARKVAIERGLTDVEVASAGTSAWAGSGPSDGSLLVALERRLDLSQHRSQQLTRELVEAQDVILAMGPSHVERLESLGGAGKTHLLTRFTSPQGSEEGVADPFGGDLELYRATADELEIEIRRAFDRIAAERPPAAP